MGLDSSRFLMDVQLLQVGLEQIGDRSERMILKALREGANEIRDLAREYAPIDIERPGDPGGDLEDAIVVDEDRGGINRRTRVFVHVDPNAYDNRGVQVAIYGMLMHEGLAPYGSGAFELGDRSRRKDGGRGMVGGKFLERAAAEKYDEIKRHVEGVAKGVFK